MMQNKTFDNYDCNLLSSKINLISNFGVGAKDLVDFYKEQYSKNNCDKIIQDSAFKEVDKITDKYQMYLTINLLEKIINLFKLTN